jgi:hypothetical protein
MGQQAVFITKIGEIPLDVSISQVHRFPSRITENPVEDGTLYSDHVVMLPVILEIEGRISDAPTSVYGIFTKTIKSQEAYQKLLSLQSNREPFEVVTGLNVYKNMLLEELQIPRTASDGQSIRFTAILREIQVIGKDVKTNREQVAIEVRHTALPIQNLGLITRILT